jgi:hypothetical protein
VYSDKQLLVRGLCRLLFTSNYKALDSSLAALSNLSLDVNLTGTILKHLNMVSFMRALDALIAKFNPAARVSAGAGCHDTVVRRLKVSASRGRPDS